MRHLSISILGWVYQAIVGVLRQWRDLHSDSWGWGADEQPQLIDQSEPHTAESDSPLVASAI